MKNRIAEEVSRLLKEHEQRNPFLLSRALDIEILRHSLCEEIKGYFFCYRGEKIIVINDRLDEHTQKIVCAHELGHAVLHDYISDKAQFTADFSVFDMTARPELEANLFAAELLISDDSVLDLLPVYDNYFAIAKELGTSPELLDFKIRMMNHKGYSLKEFANYRADYLK